MNFIELAKTALASAAAIAVLGYGVRYGIRLLKTRSVYTVQSAADYSEAVEIAVRLAEKSGMPGSMKLAIALDQVQAWLAEEMIVGRADSVTPERIKADINAVVARLFPPK